MRRQARRARAPGPHRSRAGQRRARGPPAGSPSWAPSSRRYPARRARARSRSCPRARGDAQLHGMVGAPVAVGRLGQMHGRRQHGRVLARAVVVERRRRGAGSRPSRAPWRRPSARARRRPAPPPTDPRASARRQASDVWAGARMGGAGERDLARAEAEAIGRAAFDVRHRLQRLDSGAGKNGRCNVAHGRDHLAVGPDHGERTGVRAFDERSARQLDEEGLRMGSLAMRDSTRLPMDERGHGRPLCSRAIALGMAAHLQPQRSQPRGPNLKFSRRRQGLDVDACIERAARRCVELHPVVFGADSNVRRQAELQTKPGDRAVGPLACRGSQQLKATSTLA